MKEAVVAAVFMFELNLFQIITDLIITSRPNLHQFTQVFRPGISDDYVSWNQRSTNTKQEPKGLRKRQYKNFSKKYLFQVLKKGFLKTNVLSNESIFCHFNQSDPNLPFL